MIASAVLRHRGRPSALCGSAYVYPILVCLALNVRFRFRAHVQSVVRSVQETCNFDALYAYRKHSAIEHPFTHLFAEQFSCRVQSLVEITTSIVSAPRLHPSSLRSCTDRVHWRFVDDRAKNLRPRRNIRTAMNHEIMMFVRHSNTKRASFTNNCLQFCRYAIAQKEGLGFDKAVEECKYRMSRYGVTPNVRFPQTTHNPIVRCLPLLVRRAQMLILPPQDRYPI